MWGRARRRIGKNEGKNEGKKTERKNKGIIRNNEVKETEE
jgi:hypothetical protein